MPLAVPPLAADKDKAAGKACNNGLKDPLGGGGGGVVDGGGGGGVVEGGGGGGVVEAGGGGGGGGGGVLPAARTESETGMRNVWEPLGPLSTIYTTPE